ncbi:hypothetical protein NKG05_30305 [Oerskovia sp. M15]
MDDLYEGWAGLTAGVGRLAEQVLEPLAGGRAGRYQRYDWTLGAFAEWHDVPSLRSSWSRAAVRVLAGSRT